LLVLVGIVGLAGTASVVAAVWRFDWHGLSASEWAGVAVLAGSAVLAEAYPVPLRRVAAGGISLAAIFTVGSAVLFGWGPAVVTGLLARGLIEAVQRRPPIRLAYNSALYVLSGLAGGVAAEVTRGTAVGAELGAVCAGMAGFYGVNIALVALVIACSEGVPLAATLKSSVSSTALPFAIMASAAVCLVALWDRSPLLIVALAGPLVALALYQRSAHREMEAMRLAHTDPLTGLGNYRNFQDRLAATCRAAAREELQFALCMVDLDNLKALNDRYGHPAGDSALSEIASQLRRVGEAFRLGGDEFAVLLSDRDERDAVAVAQRLVSRVAALSLEQGGRATISCGVAVASPHRLEPSVLLETADTALYWAKAQGRNRVCAYGAGLVDLADSVRLGFAAGRDAQLHAAAMLARAVDARDGVSSTHSQAVGELAARLASRLGFDDEQAELVTLAGRLHDIGKLVLPEEVLRKPDALTDEERRIVESHPAIAFRTLESLGLDTVAAWVLHHHERWDGRGYPDGLTGEQIPLAARILFVADAYESMTAAHVYRRARTPDEALAELVRCAGSQFDPAVVAALVETRARGAAAAPPALAA
jgi:diguanylate cyclase (GGDEF)-like protein